MRSLDVILLLSVPVTLLSACTIAPTNAPTGLVATSVRAPTDTRAPVTTPTPHVMGPQPTEGISFREEETPSLPRSMKGYELYSGEEEGQWHFTLMTGTNRLKSVEEISSGENVVSEDGWVKISVIGVNGIKEVFNELPQGEEVVWISKQWREQTGDAIGGIALPPEKTIWDIQEHCDDLGLRLQVVK